MNTLGDVEGSPESHDRGQTSYRWAGIGIGAFVVSVLLAGAFAIAVLISLHSVTQQTDAIAKQTNILLTTGKTSSAISAKKTEQLAEEIKSLIVAGKTSGAEASRQAAALAAVAVSVAHTTQVSLAKDIQANHGSGLVTRQILCDVAMDIHPTNPEIKRLCATP